MALIIPLHWMKAFRDSPLPTKLKRNPWSGAQVSLFRGLILWLLPPTTTYSAWQATVHEVTRVGHDLMQNHHHYLFRGFPGGAVVKNRPQCRGRRRCGFDPWVRKIPWKKKWQPDLVFLPGKFHGQRSLVGYSPWGRRVRHS